MKRSIVRFACLLWLLSSLGASSALMQQGRAETTPTLLALAEAHYLEDRMEEAESTCKLILESFKSVEALNSEERQ